MPKRKNTCRRNQSRKDHRNGIKEPDKKILSTNGMDPKLLENLRFSRMYNGIGRAEYNKLYGDKK